MRITSEDFLGEVDAIIYLLDWRGWLDDQIACFGDALGSGDREADINASLCPESKMSKDEKRRFSRALERVFERRGEDVFDGPLLIVDSHHLMAFFGALQNQSISRDPNLWIIPVKRGGIRFNVGDDHYFIRREGMSLTLHLQIQLPEKKSWRIVSERPVPTLCSQG